MQRRSFLKKLAATAALTWPAKAIPTQSDATAKGSASDTPSVSNPAGATAKYGQQKPWAPKVILFVVADDMRWDAFGRAGYHPLQTPHLDALANNGYLFQNHFVTTSICPTSRASILTGQYARRHQVWDFSTELNENQLQDCLPQRLKEGGYQTAFFGKWGIGDAPPANLFDHWEGFMGQGTYEAEARDHLTDHISALTQRFIANTDPDQPIALFVNTKAPHVQDDQANGFIAAGRFDSLYATQHFKKTPNVSTQQFQKLPKFLQTSEGRIRWQNRFATDDMYQQTCRQYHRLIAGIDDLVGSLGQSLENKFGAQNILSVFSSDNGFLLGEHGLAGKWWGFEESIRTPLIIHAPGMNHRAELASANIQALSLNIDIAPTILNIAGIDIPERMQGHTLVPAMTERRQIREDFFYEHLFDHPRIAQTTGIRTTEFKYLNYGGHNQTEMLFNLQQDPFEMQNLSASKRHRSTLLELRNRSLDYENTLH